MNRILALAAAALVSTTPAFAQASGTVTLEPGSQSLQGIRDAINKANIGVTATIVSDGGANPYHLVLSSNKTGEKSSMKISVDGVDGQPADPHGDILSQRPRSDFRVQWSADTDWTGQTIGHVETDFGVFLYLPLDDGEVEDGILTCEWHGARFDACLMGN